MLLLALRVRFSFHSRSILDSVKVSFLPYLINMLVELERFYIVITVLLFLYAYCCTLLLLWCIISSIFSKGMTKIAYNKCKLVGFFSARLAAFGCGHFHQNGTNKCPVMFHAHKFVSVIVSV